MYLFLDTETTGIPQNYRAPASDFQNWPRLVQIAWLLTNEDSTEISCIEYIVKPEGFTIPEDATKIHGITTEFACRYGIDLQIILIELYKILKSAPTLISHNIQFDEKILAAEFLRNNYPNLIEFMERRCTMLESSNFCQIPGKYGYKWPTLNELYWKLFRETYDEAHRAINDVRACSRCFFKLKELKIIA